MEAAFAWLGQLMSCIGSFIPTWEHVEYTELAILIKRGRHVRELKPGIYWYWPFWSVVYKIACVRQTINLPTQALTTEDSQRIVVGGMVRYEITNGIQALAETHEIETAIRDESLAIICEFVTGNKFSTIEKNRSQTNTNLTFKIRSALKPYGVYVQRAQLTDCCPAIALNHVGNFHNPYTESEE